MKVQRPGFNSSYRTSVLYAFNLLVVLLLARFVVQLSLSFPQTRGNDIIINSVMSGA
jgi:hypothetical protein